MTPGCAPLDIDTQIELLHETRGLSMRKLTERFRGIPASNVARAAAGMAVNPTTRRAIEAELARIAKESRTP